VTPPSQVASEPTESQPHHTGAVYRVELDLEHHRELAVVLRRLRVAITTGAVAGGRKQQRNREQRRTCEPTEHVGRVYRYRERKR
jgi:hypothetical protein